MPTPESAGHPGALRRVAIDPISRVEGHGKITILLDEANRVHQVRLHIVEFRGFEAFIEGRPYWEVPVTVQRLCGICPVSHQLAAVKAMDQIAGYGPLTPTAEKLRRLMHYGQIVQSHAVHFFHLASPDILLGFDSDQTRRNLVGVVGEYPDIARQGVFLRKFGQEIIQHVAGKRVHGTGAIPGGMNKALTVQERDTMRSQIKQMKTWSRAAIAMIKRLHAANPAFYAHFGEFPSNMMSMVAPDGTLDLYHGALRAVDANGAILFDQFDYQHYQQALKEEIKPWSYMKFPHIRALGPEQGWYKVGPLARMQTASHLSTPQAEQARQDFLALGKGRPVHGTLLYHWARLIELLHALEIIHGLLQDPDITGTRLMAEAGPRRYEAVGVIEAPRGTLFHHYRVNEDDLVSYCNLIVSTTNNNDAMNEAIRVVASQYLDGQVITEGLLNHLECAIRAFDPCLSCATHALGKMPLHVELRDAQDQLVNQRVRA